MPACLSRLSKSALAALFLFLAAASCVFAQSLPEREIIVTAQDGAEHRFEVEVASDPATRAKGLMFRDSMSDGRGMLFTFPRPRRVTMWMKDTHLPLDMLFIDSGHRVIHIKENAQPMDLSIIDSGGDAAHVLEINAGLARKLNISVGNTVRGTALEIKSSQ